MKTIKFTVATDPSNYGPDATPQDAQEFATFAYQYLQKHGYEEVEIEFVEKYPAGSADSQNSLRQEIWSAYRGR